MAAEARSGLERFEVDVSIASATGEESYYFRTFVCGDGVATRLLRMGFGRGESIDGFVAHHMLFRWLQVQCAWCFRKAREEALDGENKS